MTKVITDENEIILDSDKAMESYFSGDSYKEFLREMCKYPRLSENETNELLEKYQNGDSSAFDKLFYCNLRLVVYCANFYKKNINHLQIMDIIQEGSIALMNAIRGYKKEEGKFSSYAAKSIKRKIVRAIDNLEQTIRRSVNYEEKQRKYKMIIAECISNGQNIPSDEELCKMLNIQIHFLELIKKDDNGKTVSYNKSVNEDGDSELETFLGEKSKEYKSIEEDFDTERLLVVLKNVLKPIEYYIIYYHILYESESTLEYFGNIFNITRERIRQIEKKALQKVKPFLEEDSMSFKCIIDTYKNRKIRLSEVQTKPIEPNDIFRFLYIKDDLDELEKRLLCLKLFGELKYSVFLAMQELGCTKEEVKNIETSLKQKMANKFSDINLYMSFIKNISNAYGPDIYNLGLEDKVIDLINAKDVLSVLDSDNIDKKNKELLEKFLDEKSSKEASNIEVEKDVYLTMFGFKSEFSLPKAKLHRTYMQHNKEFTEEELLFLDTYIFAKKSKKKFNEKYPDSKLYHNHKYLIIKLEMLYYGIRNLFESPFNKDMYLSVKAKYPTYLRERTEMLLDLYFGVYLRPQTITEIATDLNEDYTAIKTEIYSTIETLKNLYHNNSKGTIIHKELYKSFVLDKKYELTEETREVLKLYIIDDLTYEEISQKLGLPRNRVTNIVNDGLRRLDYYRFGIIQVENIDEGTLAEFFVVNGNVFNQEERKIIFAKKSSLTDNTEICEKYGITQDKLTKLMMRFNKLYSEFSVRLVSLYECDIFEEIERVSYDSVITDEEKMILALYHGYRCKFNLSGVKLSKSKIAEELKKDIGTISDKINNAIIKIKKRKIDLIKPELLYIERNIVENFLNDIHLPLDDKKKDIICSLLGLKEYPVYDIEEVAKIYNTTPKNIKRQYQRGILIILKYLNHEIEGTLNYTEEIEPNLRYFSKRDRDFLINKHRDKLTNEQIAENYQLKIDYVNKRMTELHNILNGLINGNLIRFDFEMYRSLVNEPMIPFSGNFELTRKCFELYTGESTYENLSLKDIMKRLNITCSEETVSRYIKLFMLSIYRLQNGIKINYSFTDEEIERYYELNKDEMNAHRKDAYERYIKGFRSEFFSNKDNLSEGIIYDLLKARDPNIFDLNTITREEVIGILRKYYDLLKPKTRNTLMNMFKIQEKEFMSKRELERVLKLVENK